MVIATFGTMSAYADTTYSCTAVKDKANVGVHDNTTVNTTTSDRVCNFSVAGANVSTSGVSDFQAFARDIRDFIQSVRTRGQVSVPLSKLIFGPTLGLPVPHDQQDELKNQIEGLSNAVNLQDCFDDVQMGTTKTHSNGNLFCTAVGTNQTVNFGGSVSVTSPVGGLAIGLKLKLDGRTFSIFIPKPVFDTASSGRVPD
jgi:hypothetical protein